MKTTIASLLSTLALASTLCAQHFLVNFYPPNQPYAGLTNYPSQIVPVTWSTNTPGWSTNMSSDDYAAYVSVLVPIYATAQSNAQAAVTTQSNANLARLAVLYSLIQQARTMTAAGQSGLTNVYMSLASGTNTTTQVVVQVNKANMIHNDQMTIMAGVLELLQRLWPVLQQAYQPATDSTQP